MLKLNWAIIALCGLAHIFVYAQSINKPPYFVPGAGDMSRFSLAENTPIDSPVYQLKGNLLSQF